MHLTHTHTFASSLQSTLKQGSDEQTKGKEHMRDGPDNEKPTHRISQLKSGRVPTKAPDTSRFHSRSGAATSHHDYSYGGHCGLSANKVVATWRYLARQQLAQRRRGPGSRKIRLASSACCWGARASGITPAIQLSALTPRDKPEQRNTVFASNASRETQCLHRM